MSSLAFEYHANMHATLVSCVHFTCPVLYRGFATRLTILPGTPAYTQYGSRFPLTTAPAATITPSPILQGPMTVTLPPSQTCGLGSAELRQILRICTDIVADDDWTRDQFARSSLLCIEGMIKRRCVRLAQTRHVRRSLPVNTPILAWRLTSAGAVTLPWRSQVSRDRSWNRSCHEIRCLCPADVLQCTQSSVRRMDLAYKITSERSFDANLQFT